MSDPSRRYALRVCPEHGEYPDHREWRRDFRCPVCDAPCPMIGDDAKFLDVELSLRLACVEAENVELRRLVSASNAGAGGWIA